MKPLLLLLFQMALKKQKNNFSRFNIESTSNHFLSRFF